MYAKIQNGSVVEYPYGLSQLQRDNPNTSFVLPLTQDILDLSGMVEVVLTDAPEFDHTQAVVETPPELVDGQWTQQWDVISASPEEIAQREASQGQNIRLQRNQKLAESDWTQLADSAVDKQAWAVYRQALRDVPAQAGFPWEVVWPEKP